jgi:hypothetical protein
MVILILQRYNLLSQKYCTIQKSDPWGTRLEDCNITVKPIKTTESNTLDQTFKSNYSNTQIFVRRRIGRGGRIIFDRRCMSTQNTLTNNQKYQYISTYLDCNIGHFILRLEMSNMYNYKIDLITL